MVYFGAEILGQLSGFELSSVDRIVDGVLSIDVNIIYVHTVLN